MVTATVVLLRVFVGMALVASGAGKTLSGQKARREAAHAYGVNSAVVAAVALAELVAGIGLVSGVGEVLLAPFAVALFSAFALVAARRIRSGAVGACHCFGSLLDEALGRWTVIRSLIFAVAAAVVATTALGGISSVRADGLDRAIATTPAVLAVLGIFLMYAQVMRLIGADWPTESTEVVE